MNKPKQPKVLTKPPKKSYMTKSMAAFRKSLKNGTGRSAFAKKAR